MHADHALGLRPVHARRELELLTHQLRDPRAGAQEDHRPEAADSPEQVRAAAAGSEYTVASQTAAIPEPVLHTFSSERRGFFSVADGTAFSEETTFWNPSWTFARGSVQTSDIQDLTRSAIGIGTGKLLPRRLYRLQIDPRIGFGEDQASCYPGCRTLTRDKGYGLGISAHRGSPRSHCSPASDRSRHTCHPSAFRSPSRSP